MHPPPPSTYFFFHYIFYIIENLLQFLIESLSRGYNCVQQFNKNLAIDEQPSDDNWETSKSL